MEAVRQYPGGPLKADETPERTILNQKIEAALLKETYVEIDELLSNEDYHYRLVEQRVANVIDKIPLAMALHLKKKYKRGQRWEFVVLHPAFLAGRVDILDSYQRLSWRPDDQFLVRYLILVTKDVSYDLTRHSSKIYIPLKASFIWCLAYEYLSPEVLPIDYVPTEEELNAD